MQVLERVRARRIIAIVRGLAPEWVLPLSQALYEGGIDLIEVTFAQANPTSFRDTAEAIRAIDRHFAGKVLAGAGTVMSEAQVDLAQEAGAKYIISPHMDPVVIQRTKALGLCSFPGALTPTEIAAAFAHGADAVKVFPAGDLGPGYIKAVAAPLAHIPLMAVGGVNEKNAGDFLRAGAIGLGVGGNLVNKVWIEKGEWTRISELAAAYRKAVD